MTGRTGWLNNKCSEVKPAISTALPVLRSAVTLLTSSVQTDRRTDITTGLHIVSFAFTGGGRRNTAEQTKSAKMCLK